ncbi:L-lysine 6-monooxygenase [Pseudonocardiaceae bacterium YIM PH 21723]|nr:L-lysine 6-monooxygenase [Pseudonocardiaceae bacterium YIM PH 21723]
MAEPDPVYDLVGVGFGPSNLALAIAVAEHNGQVAQPVTTHFLEKQPRFGWHRGMLIDTATMQVSFLKDLVTLRNPTSEFSFLNYLHSRGRLIDFVNHKNLFPLRVEFHDYFEWAAARVNDVVSYGTEVAAVQPILDGTCFEVTDTAGRTVRARNLVLGTGLRPKLPEGVVAGPRIWHNHELLHRLPALRETQPKRLLVVGAGQSAAETAALLHDEFPGAEVCAVFARYGYSPADDSSFANRIFDPEAVDHFYRAAEPVKDSLMRYHGATNYSAVDGDLIDELYRRVYREKVLGIERLRLLNVSRPVEVRDNGAEVHCVIESLTTGDRIDLAADAVVYATGYRPADATGLLGSFGDSCLRDDAGRLRVERDYRIATESVVQGGIYLQGGTEHTHGITSSLLSNTAVRAGEILESIVERVPAQVPVGVR